MGTREKSKKRLAKLAKYAKDDDNLTSRTKKMARKAASERPEGAKQDTLTFSDRKRQERDLGLTRRSMPWQRD